MANKKNHIVAKDNNLIEAKYRLSVQEQRLMAIMVSDIHPNDKDFKNYRYKIKDILEWLNIEDSGYYKKLRAITRKLISRCITIFNPKDETIFQTSWLAGAKYHTRKGYIDLSFHPDLKPYLLQLKNCFTQYALQNVLELKSKYAFRIYEICKQYQAIGKRKFQIDELRDLLDLEKNELKRWSDFKRYVLDIAKREINKHTDIKIKYEFEKLGRKIEYITIHIKAQKKEEEIQDTAEKTRYTELIKLVRPEEQKKKTIQNAIIKYLKKKGFEYVQRNIIYANNKSEKNYRSFLIQALKEDWGLLDWEEYLDKEKRKKELEAKERERQEKIRKIEEIKEKYWKMAEEKFDSLPEEIQQEQIEKIRQTTIGNITSIEIIKSIIVNKICVKMIEEDIKNFKLDERLGQYIIKKMLKMN